MLSLLQREAEMQRPTSQIMKGPMKNKKKRLVIAEICCSQEIKGANHGTCNKHLLCVDIKALKPLEYEEMTKMLSSPPLLGFTCSHAAMTKMKPSSPTIVQLPPPPSRARLGHRRVNPLARPCQGWAFGAKGALVEAERESDALNALSVLPGTGGAGAAKHPWPLGRAAARRRGRFPWLSARPRRSPRPAIKRRGARSARSAAPTGPPPGPSSRVAAPGGGSAARRHAGLEEEPRPVPAADARGRWESAGGRRAEGCARSPSPSFAFISVILEEEGRVSLSLGTELHVRGGGVSECR